MQHLTSQVQHELDWRRAKVLELSSQGLTEREIGDILHVHFTTVHRDIQFLKQQARNNLEHHIKVVPMEYQRCMTGMKRNLKQTLEIAETVSDPKTKLQARAIANDCYKYIMDLVTNGTVVMDALSYVNGKTEKLSSAAEAPEVSNESLQTDEETTNDVF